jgi:esterase/lipase
MTTKLVEFKNKKGDILRGIFIESEKQNKKYAVLMFGGFERAGTTEKKFKKLSDNLGKYGVASLRFDATDCGLSDGDFYTVSIKSLTNDLLSAVDYLKKIGYQKFSIVGHSLAACAILLAIRKFDFEKIVLIAPALNQKDLLRYWFVKKNNPNILINWGNYKKYLKEEKFISDAKNDFIGKTHKINSQYRESNKGTNYSQRFIDFNQRKLLLIHGQGDDIVPIESLNIKPLNKIIIRYGDHDLERPELIEQWIDKTVLFLKI